MTREEIAAKAEAIEERVLAQSAGSYSPASDAMTALRAAHELARLVQELAKQGMGEG